MLELKNITKNYIAGESIVQALKGVSLSLRDSEFMSIIGPSGCGKTTILNIIGGLDRYTEGDLVIDGVSTKEYIDKDWDIYRNHSVGFVFQSYNLIPHQTVLSNVELSLTIGNVDKSLRREMAIEALSKVGLKDEINKFPNQLSGGQMQRVAIARAIVNKPKVILADEPTGALDTKTSIQVLDILKELSKDCLVVMVTHNTKLAERYSSRIISLTDGLVINDTNPVNNEEKEDKEETSANLEEKKAGMPFKTAFALSFSNMRSKIGRTILTCFAGSIGIIGIALILSVSSGFDNYIKNIEQSTISSYPISLTSTSIDITSLATSFMLNSSDEEDEPDKGPIDKIKTNYIMVDLLQSVADMSSKNDLKSFKKYLDANYSLIANNILQYAYGYDININAYDTDFKDKDGNYIVQQLEPFTLPEDVYLYSSTDFNSTFMESYMQRLEIWSLLFDSKEILNDQYDFVSDGMRWPEKYDEVVYVVNKNGELTDYTLYGTGMTGEKGIDYVRQLFKYVNNPKNEQDPSNMDEFAEFDYFSYEDFMANEFYIIPDALYYQETSNSNKADPSKGIPLFKSIKDDDDKISELLGFKENSTINENVIKLKVVGIVKENPNSEIHSISGTIGYSSKLINKLIDVNNDSLVVKTQLANPNKYIMDSEIDIPLIGKVQFGGQTFEILANAQGLSGTIKEMFTSGTAYETFLKQFGYVDKEAPSYIRLYPKTFEDKDAIKDFINEYNNKVKQEVIANAEPGKSQDEIDSLIKEKQITYTDYVDQIMGSVSTIINAITYVLIAFVSISLIVSSIMIAIITYISVLERTKEIGILRAMGASKRDVKNIFNAETFITGLLAGVIGIAITIVLNIPISLIIKSLANIKNIAVLPWEGGLILVVISVLLSVISGLIPSSFAAKRDPVVALRSE